jgi:diacylglycerol kinase family enzyme
MKNIKRGGQIALLASPAVERVAGLSDLLRSFGFSIGEQVAVHSVDARRPQGARWRRRGYVALVAAGGDGTVGAAASQIAGSDLPLGILPLGTSNDVARGLGIPLDLSAACAVIANGTAADMDVGLVIPDSSSPSGGSLQRGLRSVGRRLLPPGSLRIALAGPEARFMHAATLGLNVEFARLATDVARRQRWGPFNYAAATMEALARLHPVPVTLHLSGVRTASRHIEPDGAQAMAERKPAAHVLRIECQAVQVAIVNMPVFGGALNLRLPAAHPQDRLLDVVVIEALEPRMFRETVERLLAALGLLAERSQPALHAQPVSQQPPEEARVTDDALLVAGEAARFALPGVRHYQAERIRIQTPADVEMTLDGEIAARTPADVRLARERMRILVPDGSHL